MVLARRLMFVVLACWLALAGPAAAEDAAPLRGVALVIGTADYRALPKLANPGNDARAVSAFLGSLGFETSTVLDGDARKMRRGLERLAEDAEGADVALIYYSGHGIEAGGENYLIPVDADVPALAKAGEALLPLSSVIASLEDKARIVIVLLDACRTNPFPPGSLVSAAPGQPAVAVSASGLAVTRGITEAAVAQGAEGLGKVIGFAAEPGKVALDGPAGQNSPYATALLRHLAARGMDFGQVMTMVSEEVYLATGGAQQPWTNTSLRRLLSFGQNPESDEGDDAIIRGERRRLLLTIAETPAQIRQSVRTVAEADAVPLDTMFGILRALGDDVTGDPEALQAQLQSGAARARQIIASYREITSTDPEIARYSALAAQAIREGAVDAAVEFANKAKARIAALSPAVDEAEAALRARRVEFGAVLARSAEAHELAYDPASAAADWGDAYRQVAAWDEALAFRYKLAQARSLGEAGLRAGDADMVSMADDHFEIALSLEAARKDPGSRAEALVARAELLAVRGARTGEPAFLDRAAAAYREAATLRESDPDRSAWAAARFGLGNVLQTRGRTESDTRHLEDAIAAYDAAATGIAANSDAWARLNNNRGNALVTLASRGPGREMLMQGIASLLAALEVRRVETRPLAHAITQNNLGNAYAQLAQLTAKPDDFKRAASAYAAAISGFPVERFPQYWAAAQNNRAFNLMLHGEQASSPALLTESIAGFDAALTIRLKASAPLYWSQSQAGRGRALVGRGEMTSSRTDLTEGRGALVAARDIFRGLSIDMESYFEPLIARADAALARLTP